MNTNLLIKKNITINDAFNKMNEFGYKSLIVVDDKNRLLGILSDGDIRRSLMKGISLEKKINNIYNRNPVSTNPSYNIDLIKKIFLKDKFEFIPIINSERLVLDILFWNDVFKRKKHNITNYININAPVVIMSGGKGTRMAPFTNILPKALLPIENKTVLEKILDNFNKHNVKEYYITTNYKHNIVKFFISETVYKNKIKIINENKPLGTAGSLSLIKQKLKKPFFVTNCDILIDADYSEIFEFHKKNKNVLTIVAATNEIKIEYGVCNLNSDGSLKNIDEKPKINFLSNTGLYLMNPACLNLIPKNKYFNMDTLINSLLHKNKKIGIFPIHSNAWKDTGQWTEFNKINND